MRLCRTCTGLLALMLIGVSALTGVVSAGESDIAGNALLPVIPPGAGDTCVEDTAFMRRNHMELLKHQRDETLLKGVRSEQYSLKECLSCHAVYGPDAIAVTVANPAHFCRSCHDYAAVSIDCFQCHA
jgi:predicted CXXCH cytochrome family protein